MFQFSRPIHFYETDAMGIVHHANYVYFMEEARVGWLKQFSSSVSGNFLEEVNYPVLDLDITYKNPLRFNDELTIEVKARVEGARLIFEYVLASKSFDNPVAFGKTVHAAFCMKTRKPIRLPQEVKEWVAQSPD